MRKTQEELNKLKKEKGVNVLWSFSRFDTFRTSPYEYMLKYIKHVPEDRQDCIYTSCGSLCHDTLDRYYEGEITYEQMIEEFKDGWIVNRDISKLLFDRTDAEKDVCLSEKYYDNLIHFFKNHKPINAKKVIIEPFVHLNVGKNVFIGYIDALYKDANGYYNIVDFKSSSIYTGKTLISHSMQLILYSMALIQNGIDISLVKPCFNFLKYTKVEYMQANGKVKSRNIERRKIGESLQSICKTKLKKCGYSDSEIDDYLKLLLDTNNIECLPKEVQDEFAFSDCYVYIPLSEKLIEDVTKEIIVTITDIEAREKDFKETNNPNIFWDSEESVKKQGYYFANLCGYSSRLHKPYAEFLSKLEKNENGFGVFSGVGGSNSSGSNVGSENKNINDMDSLDLSWLEDIV